MTSLVVPNWLLFGQAVRVLVGKNANEILGEKTVGSLIFLSSDSEKVWHMVILETIQVFFNTLLFLWIQLVLANLNTLLESSNYSVFEALVFYGICMFWSLVLLFRILNWSNKNP